MTRRENLILWKEDIRDEIIDSLAVDNFCEMNKWLDIYVNITELIRNCIRDERGR